MSSTARDSSRPPLRRGLREAAGILGLALALALAAAWLHPRRPDFDPHTYALAPELPLARLAALPGSVLWIDARSEAAFAAAHIPDAVPLNEDHWETLLPGVVERWQPGVTVVVYCDHRQCQPSQQVARRLRRDLGIDSLYVLEGGWQAWQEAHP